MTIHIYAYLNLPVSKIPGCGVEPAISIFSCAKELKHKQGYLFNLLWTCPKKQTNKQMTKNQTSNDKFICFEFWQFKKR